MSKDEYLITDPPLKALTVFAMPMILGSFFQQVYNMADSIIVGQFVGSSALAAVGACAALTNVFICVALGAGVGAGVLVSRYFGAKNYGKMKTIVSTSLISFLILSVVLGVFGFCFSHFMMSGLQTPADILEKADDFDVAVHDLIKEYAIDHQRIVFNGNGYAPEWAEEAKRRGLPNLPSMVDAIPALTTPKAVKLFEEFHVFTKTELESRAEIKYETYNKAINIEAKTMIDMAGKEIIPAVISYTTELANSVLSVKEAGADASVQADILTEVSGYLKEMKAASAKLAETVATAATFEGKAQAEYFRDTVKVAMDELRAPVDKAEMIVDKEFWPFPSYSELLFEV